MTANNIQKKLLAIGVALAIVMGIISLSIIPNVKKINALVDSIIKSNTERDFILTSKTQTQDLKEKMLEYQQGFSLESIDSMLVKKDEYKDFFNSIYDLAEKQSLECELKYSGDSSKTETKSKEDFIIVNVQTKGDFNNSVLFLEKLENYPYLLDIAEYKIIKQPDGKISSNYNLKVYANPQN